jgi:recombination protein RecT
MNQVATQKRPADPIARIRDDLVRMASEFKAALPSHIPEERFRRVAITAIQRNPDLVMADRKSLFGACMMSAQDGLLPDGREAALVIFKTKVKVGGVETWVPMVQYMPMISGIRKKVLQSGEIATLNSRVVRDCDHFKVVYGDEERIEHEPNLYEQGEIIAAYAIATHKDGTKSRDVMTVAEIEQVRLCSKSGTSGPWRDWYSEMARKTVIRRLAKSLPLSTELDEFMRRDDNLYDLDKGTQQPAKIQASAPLKTIDARLDDFANGDVHPDDDVSESSSSLPNEEVSGSRPEAGNSSGQSAPSVPENGHGNAAEGADAPGTDDKVREAMESGRAACRGGYSRDVPKKYAVKSKQAEREAYLQGWDEEHSDQVAADAGVV